MRRSLFVILVLVLIIPFEVNAQRGCCSHHGGVAGCHSSGKQLCNDGTLSPSCTCTLVVKTIYGCTDPDAKNYNSEATKDNGSCKYYTYGCTDSNAINYNSKADKNDESCKYHVYGCMNPLANNYNANATIDDSSCEYGIYGCTDINANNYNKDANIDDNSCIYNVYGCTDKRATNYNSLANIDDGSCEYKTIVGIDKNEIVIDESTDEDESGNGTIGFLVIVGIVAYGIYYYKKHQK